MKVFLIKEFKSLSSELKLSMLLYQRTKCTPTNITRAILKTEYFGRVENVDHLCDW